MKSILLAFFVTYFIGLPNPSLKTVEADYSNRFCQGNYYLWFSKKFDMETLNTFEQAVIFNLIERRCK